MPVLQAAPLREYVARILLAAGAPESEAQVVAAHLVEANLKGHDSHGVIRVERYVRDIADGRIVPGAPVVLDRESETTAVLDGGWNFGQVVAQRAMELAIAKARGAGAGIVVAHRCGHVGRVGAYGEQAAAQGLVGIAMVNNHGGGQVMSVPGGLARRLSPNPVVVAVPTGDPEAPFVLDMTTSVVAEGKVRVARNRGDRVPEGWIVDAEGRPTTDPAGFYGPPPGSILPLGGEAAHKGFGLALVVEALAGALSPAGTSRPDGPSGANGLFVMALDIERFRPLADFTESFAGLLAYVKSPPLREGVTEVLVAGDPERRAHAARSASGIALDDETWRQLIEAGQSVGVEEPGA